MSHTRKKDFTRFRNDLIHLMEDELPDTPESEIYADMLLNIGKLQEEKFDILELRLLNTAFKELRYAMKVFKPYRNVPKAAVFGSARTPAQDPSYKMAADFGAKLAKKGWMIITGGASGIMEAAMVGAGAKCSFGLNILLPFEQSANSVILGNQKLIFFKYFFTRKLMFLKESQATVLFPGGFGTLDEGFESFTLVQTGKARPRPLVVLDPPGSPFWESTLKLLKTNMLETRLISPRDLRLIRHFHDNTKAVNELTGFYSNYDSSRFMKDAYLIRVRRPVSDRKLKELNESFKDIIASGEIERLTDLSLDDNKDTKLHRLVFRFDRTGYARIRELIDALNSGSS